MGNVPAPLGKTEHFYLRIHLQHMLACHVPFIPSRIRPKCPGYEKVEHEGWDVLIGNSVFAA